MLDPRGIYTCSFRHIGIRTETIMAFSIGVLSELINDRVLTNTSYLYSYPFDMFCTDFKQFTAFSSNNNHDTHTVLKY